MALGLVLLCVGVLMLFPAYVEYACEDQTNKDCASYHVVLVALWKIGKALSDAVFVTALSTAAIAGFTWTLWQSTEKLWAAGEKQRELAEKTAERQLRAYVVVHLEDIIIPKPGDDHIAITQFQIKNTGQTPAYNLQTISKTRVVDYPFPDDFDFLTFSPPGDHGTGTLGPGESIATEGKSPILTEEEWAAIRSKASGKRLCTWGIVTYRDVFESIHHTNFCVSCFFRPTAWTGGREIAEGHIYKRHNDAT